VQQNHLDPRQSSQLHQGRKRSVIENKKKQKNKTAPTWMKSVLCRKGLVPKSTSETKSSQIPENLPNSIKEGKEVSFEKKKASDLCLRTSWHVRFVPAVRVYLRLASHAAALLCFPQR
jgi:hypothetical protein